MPARDVEPLVGGGAKKIGPDIAHRAVLAVEVAAGGHGKTFEQGVLQQVFGIPQVAGEAFAVAVQGAALGFNHIEVFEPVGTDFLGALRCWDRGKIYRMLTFATRYEQPGSEEMETGQLP